MTTIYLSTQNLPEENYRLIAEFDARITKEYADQLELKKEDLPSHEDYPASHLTWTALAIFAAGFFIAQISSIRSGLSLSAAGLSLYFYSHYRAKNSLNPNTESSPTPLEIEAEKTKKIYEKIFTMLAYCYIHKTNFVFEKVNALIREKNLKDINTIFATVKEQVEKYDEGKSKFTSREDFEMALNYFLLQSCAITLLKGAKIIGPGKEYMGGYFMLLSNLSWEFAYGAGMNPSVDWVPPGVPKRYFLQMKPSQNGQSWTVEKFIPQLLKPF